MFATIQAPPRRAPKPGARVSVSSPVAPPSRLPGYALALQRETRHFHAVLPASGPGKQALRWRGLSASLTTHSIIAVSLMILTRAAAAPPATAVLDTTMIFLPRMRAVETRTPPAVAPARPAGGGGGLLVIAAPPPRGFQTIVAPSMVPSQLPSVNLDEAPLDPRNYTGIGVEGGVAVGVPGGTGPVDLRMLDGVEGIVFAEATPDIAYRKAEVLSQPRPRFPGALQQAGIEGGVILRFVIDTLGLVDPGSIVTIEQAHPLLGQAATEALLESRFTPARYGNRRVRQLTIQKFSFRLE